MNIIVETPRLIVREYEEGDLPLRQILGADEEIRRFTPNRTPEETEKLFRDNLELYKNGNGLARWAVIDKQSGLYAGDCMLMPARAGFIDFEVGYMFDKKFWGQGLATELVKALVQYAFEALALPAIYAITSPENIASQKVLLKAGFYEGEQVMMNEMPLNFFSIKNPITDRF